MIEPGTERQHPAKPRRARRRSAESPPRPGKGKEGDGGRPDEAAQTPDGGRGSRPRRRERRGRRRERQPRTGSFEKRAGKVLVPITKEMEEGREAMRTFGDLWQFHQKKLKQDESSPKGENGAETKDGAGDDSA